MLLNAPCAVRPAAYVADRCDVGSTAPPGHPPNRSNCCSVLAQLLRAPSAACTLPRGQEMCSYIIQKGQS